MSAIQNEKPDQVIKEVLFEQIAREGSQQSSIWGRIKKALKPSDLTLEKWTQLEMKRCRTSLNSDHRRDS